VSTSRFHLELRTRQDRRERDLTNWSACATRWLVWIAKARLVVGADVTDQFKIRNTELRDHLKEAPKVPQMQAVLSPLAGNLAQHRTFPAVFFLLLFSLPFSLSLSPRFPASPGIWWRPTFMTGLAPRVAFICWAGQALSGQGFQFTLSSCACTEFG